jgi:lysophospholipase L1-like esterase
MEGKAWIQINARGFRDVDHELEKPEGVYRVVVLGDSYTAAQEVDFEAAFPRVAERHLNEGRDGQRRVEVVNLGCSGYGTADQLLVWRHEGRLYDADLVLLGFMTANDVTDNFPTLDPRARPYFQLQNGELKLDNSFLESSWYTSRTSASGRAFYWLLDYSRLAQLLNTARLRWKAASLAATAGDMPHEDVGVRVGVYSPPNDDDWRRAWQVTEALLAQLDREVRSSGADFAVVTLSNSSQVTPDDERRDALLKRLNVDNLYYPDERVAAFCAQQKIPCLMLAPQLLAIAQQSGKSLHGFGEALDHGHWNEEGHQAAGEMIADWVAEHILDAAK